MSYRRDAEDYMVDEFLILAGVDTKEAQSALQDANAILVVMENQEGQACAVVGPQGKGMMLTVQRTTPIHDIVEVPEILEAITAGAPGIVVVENGEPIGVVPDTAIVDYLHQYKLATDTFSSPGDSLLYGIPHGIELVVACDTCKYVNHKQQRIVLGETMCGNPDPKVPLHHLVIKWE